MPRYSSKGGNPATLGLHVWVPLPRKGRNDDGDTAGRSSSSSPGWLMLPGKGGFSPRFSRAENRWGLSTC
jgi:hypothetical protein